MKSKKRRSIQVRIDPDVGERVVAEAKRNQRSNSREATLSLARYYTTRKKTK